MKISDISVEYMDHMGSDCTVVNAARVSFNKEIKAMSLSDVKLLQYLAKHRHWSPFAHTSIQFRCKAPIFLARQLVKHQVGGVWNEVSRRYVDSAPEFYIPQVVHKYPQNAKQGCGGEHFFSEYFVGEILAVTKDAESEYNRLIAEGIAPEEARMVLPLNTMTEWIWTGSLMFWYRVWSLRHDPHAQSAAREFADLLYKAIPDDFKESMQSLVDYYGDA